MEKFEKWYIVADCNRGFWNLVCLIIFQSSAFCLERLINVWHLAITLYLPFTTNFSSPWRIRKRYWQYWQNEPSSRDTATLIPCYLVNGNNTIMDIKKQNMVNSIFDTFSSVYFFTLMAEELSITTTKINRHGLLDIHDGIVSVNKVTRY